MPVARVLYQDPFSPLLKNSPPVTISPEQWRYIGEVLKTACSDNQFASKAFNAIHYILTGGNTVSSEVTSLSPSSVTLGAPSFDLHVRGKNFKPDSKIIFAGNEEPTTFISESDITTGVNMDVWLGPDIVPVEVQDANGLMSEPAMFTFNAATRSAQSKTDEKVLHHDEGKK